MKMRQIKTAILIVAYLMPMYQVNAINPTQIIRGQVIDATNGYPLIGANVVLLNSEPLNGNSTDLNGMFTLENVPLGRQSIQVSYLGYKPKIVNNLLLISGKETNLIIKLDEDITQVEEITVKANRNKEQPLNEMAMISARSFSIEETERFAGSLGDPAKMASNFAGVTTQGDARNDIIIRGNSPAGVLWRLEGVEIANPNHFGALGTTGGSVGMINNNLLANSDFITGAFPAEYGNALSGVFDLNLRSGNSQNGEYMGQVGMGGFELGAEGPLFSTGNGQKASYLINGRYSTMEVMNILGFDVGTGSSIPEYKDLTFIVDIPGTKVGRFKVFGLFGVSYIELGRDLSDTAETSYSTRGTGIDFGSGVNVIGASHTYFFNKNIKLQTTVSYQKSYSKTAYDSVKNESFMPVSRSNLTEYKLSASTRFSYKLNLKNTITAGIQADLYHINYLDSTIDSDLQKFLTQIDIDARNELYHGFIEWQHRFSDQITAYGGLNSSYFSQTEESTLEPRLSLRWQLNPKHSITAGYGMHSQIQAKVVYYYETYDEETYSYFKTNEKLKSTKSNHYILGYQYLIAPNLNLKTELYYQQLHNVPVKESFGELSLLNSGTDFGVYMDDSLVNKGTGRNYGLELTFEKYLSQNYYFMLTSSLFQSKYKGYDNIERNTLFNSNFALNLLAGYEHKINEKYMLTFDFRGVWSGGNRYIPIDYEASEAAHYPEYDYTHSYNNRYPDYFRIDLRLGIKHNAKRYSQELAIDLQNLTNHNNILMESYDATKNEVYYVYQTSFYPMALWRINF